MTIRSFFEASFRGDETICKEINNLGVKSGEAQGLSGPITSVEKLENSGQTILIYFDTANSSIPAGYIKFGKKHLYFYNKQGKVLNGEVLCVLDFFVREDIQRHGVGLQLFSAMLEELHESPSNLAYDRPSPKLIEFLKKHFQLCNPDFQPNRFVVYDGVLSFLGAKEVRMK